MLDVVAHGILSKEMKERAISTATPGECITRKLTPVECIKAGFDIGSASPMTPKELTPDDAKYILENGYGPATIQTMYGFKSPGTLYYKLMQWGLHKKGERRPSVSLAQKKKHGHNPVVRDLKTFQESMDSNIPKVEDEMEDLSDSAECIEVSSVALDEPVMPESNQILSPSRIIDSFKISEIISEILFFESHKSSRRPQNQVDFIIELLQVAQSKMVEHDLNCKAGKGC